MTYCVGMMLNKGLVFMSDTRTNAGLDNISTFGKMKIWEAEGDRVITLLSAGNLATTQAVVSELDERVKAHAQRNPSIFEAASMYQVACLVADTLRDVIARNADSGQRADAVFNATLLLGGQIAGGPPRLFLIYPEGNFIEAGPDTPFFQIGEIKYGRPILVRAYDPDLSFNDAIKLLLVSFDSTVKANLTVGAPFDYHLYRSDSLVRGDTGRIELDDPYFQTISQGWSDALKLALDSLPAFGAPLPE
ncbi:peptidase [Mameliella sediminis]|uniref:peptidase n=1 Tax=Mameliella sediminis TaxID=2836866 RepID=UPI001C43CB19|nr:peptidase [Mameliella sediminis]MBY6117181.1 peptidase [Antarctobacter heliothermus]MBY6147037.1 peptidase [Mameliella alba]MBV7396591.1 peptidase [Mameliella sediminis]MBY6162880.1 peptidase [Mameliella alba]MBY6171144.1 peptidase [Mameliella alba]